MLFLFFWIFSCGEDDVTDRCEIVSGHVIFQNSEIAEQYIFTVRGELITELEIYRRNNSGVFGPSADTRYLFQYENERIIEERRFQDDVDSFFLTKYIYENDSLYQRAIQIADGDTVSDETFRIFNLKEPDDGFYEYKSSLYEFRKRNLIRIGVQDPGGSFIFGENTFRFVENYFYDKNEKFITDPVIAKVLGFHGLSEASMLSRNNLIKKEISGNTYEFQYEFDKNDRLTKFTVDNQKSIEFQYICN